MTLASISRCLFNNSCNISQHFCYYSAHFVRLACSFFIIQHKFIISQLFYYYSAHIYHKPAFLSLFNSFIIIQRFYHYSALLLLFSVNLSLASSFIIIQHILIISQLFYHYSAHKTRSIISQHALYLLLSQISYSYAHGSLGSTCFGGH